MSNKQLHKPQDTSLWLNKWLYSTNHRTMPCNSYLASSWLHTDGSNDYTNRRTSPYE